MTSFLTASLCVFAAKAAITKSHRPGGLNQRNVLSHNAGGQKSKIRVLPWHSRVLSDGSREGSVPDLS